MCPISSFYEYKKQNIFRIYWLWSIFLFFRSFIKKDIRKIIVFFYKEKSCINQSGIRYKSINPKRYLKGRKKKIEEFIIDEILIKIGSELIWLWVVAIELESKEILGISITKERNMVLAERFISSLVGIHGQHPVSTDGEVPGSYPQACRFLDCSSSYPFLL